MGWQAPPLHRVSRAPGPYDELDRREPRAAYVYNGDGLLRSRATGGSTVNLLRDHCPGSRISAVPAAMMRALLASLPGRTGGMAQLRR